MGIMQSIIENQNHSNHNDGKEIVNLKSNSNPNPNPNPNPEIKYEIAQYGDYECSICNKPYSPEIGVSSKIRNIGFAVMPEGTHYCQCGHKGIKEYEKCDCLLTVGQYDPNIINHRINCPHDPYNSIK